MRESVREQVGRRSRLYRKMASSLSLHVVAYLNCRQSVWNTKGVVVVLEVVTGVTSCGCLLQADQSGIVR